MMKYSKKEWRLIDHFKFMKVAEHVFPPVLYSFMASKAFIMNEQGPYADSLRRAVCALESGKINRLTPEWESLIQLPEESS